MDIIKIQLDNYAKYNYDCPIVLEVREHNYLECNGYLTSKRLIDKYYNNQGGDKMNKPNINTLLNADNIFGTYENKVAPFILTVLLGSIPLFIWLLFLQGTPIKMWMAILTMSE